MKIDLVDTTLSIEQIHGALEILLGLAERCTTVAEFRAVMTKNSQANRVRKGTRRFTIECLRSGQPRPYADHEGVYRIAVEWIAYQTNEWEMNEGFIEEKVKKVARAFIGWNENPTTPFDTRLESFTKIGPALWEVRTRAAYTG